ncbi:Ig-like domain-containing protein [Salmonella enterica]|uniref:Ig-like domain-containing protein n=1 Tax=Salmonella enterica TaxID=28901 RepID=UPI00196038E7|nr:Ig-like domain-containing protein [Salmonella enterica]
MTVTGSRQPTETDTSHTAATADGADLLTLHFKAADGNGNAITSTPVHYTTAVSDAGIVKDALACTTNGSGECTSTVKTTKAGTYNVWTALVPAGAARQVSPVKTALVFLAGPPDATNTTVSTDKSAANADKKETISVTLTPRDSHNNVVPLWTFRNDLTITPSVNATVSGAVTVTAPAQDATGNVTATLTYVDTSGKLLSKEARGGTTEVAIGKSVKKSVDARFYPEVHVCLATLSSQGFVVPGKTEVQLCDVSEHAIPSGSGYAVHAPGISPSGCPTNGGGVCPSDTPGIKADFTNVTGDDIKLLAGTSVYYTIEDKVSGESMESAMPKAFLVYYGELRSHYNATWLGASEDLWHADDATRYCDQTSYLITEDDEIQTYDQALQALKEESATAGGDLTRTDGVMKSLFIGDPGHAFNTGGDTNPEVFTAGVSLLESQYRPWIAQYVYPDDTGNAKSGSVFPMGLLFVNGRRHAYTSWSYYSDGIDELVKRHQGTLLDYAIGQKLVNTTNWNLSDLYYVNDFPGEQLDIHKATGDHAYPFVTQVNYVTGFICVASLH